MKVLLLCHAFNGLAQRLFVELRAAGHAVSVELDIADAVTEEAVARWQPDLVLAPFLKRRIPESVWSRVLCWVVHPGPPGDGGPHALDWAIERGLDTWGVTVLQAVHDYDAGPIWAWRPFAMRPDAGKGSLYRHEVTTAAVAAVFDALRRWRPGATAPSPAPDLPAQRGRWQPAMTAAQRAIDWQHDDTATVLRRLRAADGMSGVRDTWFDVPVRLFDGHAASAEDLARAPAGDLVARRGPALLRRTADGGVWIGHVKRGDPPGPKLAATRAFAAETQALPELAVPLQRDDATWDELRYRRHGAVGTLSFAFHNGAMSVRQARRLIDALAEVARDDARVLVLDGGPDFFGNGIHLHDIEAASLEGGSAADASMAAIEAIDDVALAILQMTDRLTVAALRGNAGAGGCFLALAADAVWLHRGVVQNPHYRNMGNLHGSEYWTYLLPRRVGPEQARQIMRGRLPMGAEEALQLGLADAVLADDASGFDAAVAQAAQALAGDPDWAIQVAAKAARRAADEAQRPLAAYRADELAAMRVNFYGFDPSYHVARHHFVHRKPHAWTPRHLALHR
ncbi:MAG: hydrogenase maturation protein [Burkholderiaceae bacterium]|nr:hydrogenase maturation protein [Burkholderiaceae bacterium]